MRKRGQRISGVSEGGHRRHELGVVPHILVAHARVRAGVERALAHYAHVQVLWQVVLAHTVLGASEVLLLLLVPSVKVVYLS